MVSDEAHPESNLVLSGDLYATTLGLVDVFVLQKWIRNPQIVCLPSTTKCHFP